MITEKTASDFRDRLSCLIKQDGRTPSEIARAIDETPQLLRKWLCCNVLSRLPAANYVLKLADCFGVNARWLISGEGPVKNTGFDTANSIEVPTIRAHLANTKDEPLTDDDIFRLPNSRLRNKNFSAIKIPFFVEIAERTIIYKKNYLESLGADPESCARILTPEGAMEPLVKENDYVLLDCADNEIERIKNNAMYVFAYNENLYIRRLIREFTSIVFDSSNPVYSRKDITIENAKESMRIVGRVLERSGPI